MVPQSPASEASGMTPLSPTASTPPPKSDTASDAPTPPSPPLSDDPAHGKREQKTPVPAIRRRSLIPDSAATPRPRGLPAKHSRGPSVASTASTAMSDLNKSMRPPTNRPKPARPSNAPNSLPKSDSLYQIRGLIGRMQKIEERVQNARSKLPAPGGTPRGSPRTGSALSESIPSSVTVRRSSKRPSASRTSSMADDTSILEDESTTGAPPRRESHIKRLSFGIPRPASQATHRSDMPDRPPSAMDRPPSAMDRPPSVAASRPSSRASIASLSNRPPSRSGARTELGHYSGTASSTSAGSHIPGRPRSSLGGSYSAHGHRPSSSVTDVRRKVAGSEDSALTTSPTRRKTLEKGGIRAPTALPTPSALNKSQNGGLRRIPGPGGVRTSNNNFAQVKEEEGDMKPPPRRRQMSEVGETY